MQVANVNIDTRTIYSGTTGYLTEKISSSFNTNQNDGREKTNDLSKEQKNSLITEKLSGEQVDSPNEIRFQDHTPVAKLLDIIKNFNETTFTNQIKMEESPFISEAQFQEMSKEIAEETPIGYYVVIDDTKNSPKQKMLKGRFDLVKEKISKTYNLGFRKENGSLVNLSA